jgi:hypothetical protein
MLVSLGRLMAIRRHDDPLVAKTGTNLLHLGWFYSGGWRAAIDPRYFTSALTAYPDVLALV